jgi:hypothetical protein
MRSCLALLLALFTSPALAQPADMVLRGGNIITVDGGWHIVQALAIKDGRFLTVGNDAAVAAHVGLGTQVVELAGKTVVPGLIDSHLHQLFAALNGPAVQLLGAKTVADVQTAVAERVARTEPGKWVIASSGWHESILDEGRMPTRFELDKAAPNNPVFIPRGGHVVTVNSKALELAGITKDTPNPEGGVIVRDEATGEATGVLLETAANLGPQGPAAAAGQPARAPEDRNGRPQFLWHRRRGRAGDQRAADRALPCGARCRRDDGAHRRPLSGAAQERGRERHRGAEGAAE